MRTDKKSNEIIELIKKRRKFLGSKEAIESINKQLSALFSNIPQKKKEFVIKTIVSASIESMKREYDTFIIPALENNYV